VHSPQFGNRKTGVQYSIRPSAYIVIQDEAGNIATTRSPHGHFLPGGGIDPGESAQLAAVREAHEECGFIIANLQHLCDATEFVHSLKYQTHYEKRSTFFTADIVSLTAATEPSHQLLWLSLEEALRQLTHESHSYAVKVFLALAQQRKP
jgi:8-oxo-dGTP diphosphatase